MIEKVIELLGKEALREDSLSISIASQLLLY